MKEPLQTKGLVALGPWALDIHEPKDLVFHHVWVQKSFENRASEALRHPLGGIWDVEGDVILAMIYQVI